MTAIHWLYAGMIAACLITAAVAIVAIRRDERQGAHVRPGKQDEAAADDRWVTQLTAMGAAARAARARRAKPSMVIRSAPDVGERAMADFQRRFQAAVEETPLPVMRGQLARIGAGIDAATQTAPWLPAQPPPTAEPPLAPLPAQLHTGYLHAAPDTPAATFDAAVTDLSMRAIPGRTILREHVAATMKHTRSPLGAWVDEVLAADVPLVDQELGLLGARLELREVTRG